MSGFAAIFNLDGAPVDRVWLEKMADFLVSQGFNSEVRWISNNVAICQTHLCLSSEPKPPIRIDSLDGRFRVVGDIRIDDRETLIAELSSDSFDSRSAGSAGLILHAYAKWGASCVEHLLGDFSFVIWDARRNKIFAARDQMGVKSFYYAQVGQCLLISNMLDCIRQVPIVSSELNDRAIGDFLLVGQNQYPTETYFASIQRLPVAHALLADSEGVRTQRYWTLPADEPVYYKHAHDYVDRFNELVQAAVRDRLPVGPLGILMSGGLDSPLLAATAVSLGAKTTAFTCVYDRLIPDDERHYAGLVAQHLGIPILYRVMDDEPLGWETGELIHTPEPSAEPHNNLPNRQYNQEISVRAKVFLGGLGPDVALGYEWRSHVNNLLRNRRWLRLGLDLVSDFVAYPRVHFFHRVPRILEERSAPDLQPSSFPAWFNSEFQVRLRLKERWEHICTLPIQSHPARPQGYSLFACDFPMGGLEEFDVGQTGVPTEFRHPFFDLRLLRFLLAVPAMPWCREKYLLRAALRGLIPDAVRLRPKAPVNGLPYLERIRRSQYPTLPASPLLERYVDRNRLVKAWNQDREGTDGELRTLGLQLWLLRV